MEQEFQGTLNWFANPASQVSAHDVIAFDGTLCYVVADELESWHAGYYNAQWLGIELVQPQLGDPISDAQIKTLRWRLDYLASKYAFVLRRENLPQHSQTQQGISIGKSDAIPRDDQSELDAFYVRLLT